MEWNGTEHDTNTTTKQHCIMKFKVKTERSSRHQGCGMGRNGISLQNLPKKGDAILWKCRKKTENREARLEKVGGGRGNFKLQLDVYLPLPKKIQNE